MCDGGGVKHARDGMGKEGRHITFSVVSSDRTRGNGHNLKYRKFCLNVRTIFLLQEWSNSGTGCPEISALGDVQSLDCTLCWGMKSTEFHKRKKKTKQQ